MQTKICLLENSFKYFLCRTSVKNFSFDQKREETMHYLYFRCHEEERKTSPFAKITHINSYKQRALLLTKYEHSYS